MNTSLFETFNNMVDIGGLQKDISEVAANSGNREEVPKDDYEIEIVKIELGETSGKSKTPGLPQGKVWFKILAGEHKGRLIFMNQNLTQAFQLVLFNEFLENLGSEQQIVFENYVQYGHLLNEIYSEIKDKYEYQLKYGENSKGYSTYEIVQKFTK